LCTVAHRAEAEARRLAKRQGDAVRKPIIDLLIQAINARETVGLLHGGDDPSHRRAIDWLDERVRELESNWPRVRNNALQLLASRA
jgi:hypothetical protein